MVKKCQFCGEFATEVNHLSISKDVLEGKDDAKLVSLCKSCYKALEYDKDGYKNSPKEKYRIVNIIKKCEEKPKKSSRKTK